MPLHKPRYRQFGSRLALAVSATALAATGVALAPVALAKSPATRSAVPTPRRLDNPVLRKVLLLNGDELTITQSRTRDVSSLVPAPFGGALLTLHLAGSTYDVPVDALPYFGHGLDPSLFNRALLARHEPGGRLAVKVTFAGSQPALPGITIASRAGRVATGYLTQSSAKVFGAALFRQFAAQHATGRYTNSGMFAGGVSIALAGAHAGAPVTPAFPMHTLTLTGTNIAGKADSGDPMLVFNADNQTTFGDPFEIENAFFHGTAKYSVPAGHYWAITDFLSVRKHNVAQRLVIIPQFTVAANRKLHLSAREATSQISFTTPRRAENLLDTFTILRSGKHGFPAIVNAASVGGPPIFVNPVRTKPTVGSIQTFTAATLVSPKKAKGGPYAYNLDFAGPRGVIPSQHFDVTQASVATVHERFFLNSPQLGFWSTTGETVEQATQTGFFSLAAPIRLPAKQTQFMAGSPGVLWTSSFFVGNQGLSDAVHGLRAGHQSTENWNNYPLHPQSFVQLLSGRAGRKLAEFPTWFRTGNSLFLEPSPFSDNALGHTGEGNAKSTFVVKQNGKEIGRGRYFFGVDQRVSSKPSTISFSLQSAMPSPLSILSPQTTTTWKFRTARNPGARLPRNWVCINVSFGLSQKCSAPDVLTLNYLVSGLALNGVTPAGQQTINVSVGNAEPAPQTKIVKANAQVSYDGGKFFQPVTVTRTGTGTFKVTFNPPAGVDVTTRFTATDSQGSSITETITNGYSVGPQA